MWEYNLSIIIKVKLIIKSYFMKNKNVLIVVLCVLLIACLVYIIYQSQSKQNLNSQQPAAALQALNSNTGTDSIAPICPVACGGASGNSFDWAKGPTISSTLCSLGVPSATTSAWGANGITWSWKCSNPTTKLLLANCSSGTSSRLISCGPAAGQLYSTAPTKLTDLCYSQVGSSASLLTSPTASLNGTTAIWKWSCQDQHGYNYGTNCWAYRNK